MINAFNKAIKYRYALALVVFILGLVLNLNGSSIASWNRMGVTELQNGVQSKSRIEGDGSQWLSPFSNTDGVIFGIPRGIRSDEWMVQTSFFISQVNSGNQLVNENYGLSGQNMIVAYHSPVNHISILGKPFNWGALFLSPSRALSWYWCFKIITLILLSFEFIMILTKGNKVLSFIAAFFITYTPVVQWWFMQHLGDVVWFTLLALVSIYYYFSSEKLIAKISFATLLSSSLIGFVLVIYPAFQVVFAYIILIYFLVKFFTALRKKQLSRNDWIIMFTTLCVTAVILGVSIYQSLDAIIASLETVYPGSRVSTGGGIPLTFLVTIFLNLFLPYKLPTILNQVELASSLNFLPFMLLALPFIISKKQIKENLFGILLSLYSVFLMLYIFVGVPEWLAKITLFSYVTSGRAWQALAVIAVFISFWFIDFVWKMECKKLFKVLLPISILSFILFAYLISYNQVYKDYISRSYILLSAFLLFLTFLLGILKYKKLFTLSMLILSLLTGFTVNPIVRGTAVVENKKLGIAIKDMVKRNPQSIWLTDNNMLYNYPQMFGAKMINGVRFYPDIEEMKKIDINGKYVNEWNRYAHIKPILVADRVSMSNSSPDVLDMQVNTVILKELHVNYVISSRDLETKFGKEFQLLYGPDKDGNRIYQFNAEY